jgi:proline iminopeptidase
MIPLTPGDYNLPTADGTLRFSIADTGPACIALAGGPGIDARYFEDLGGITDIVTLISLHPRGSAGSPFPAASDWSLAAYARDVAALRQHLGIARPLVLGHSHGGWIAQRYALDYPTALAGLILVGTAPAGIGALAWDPEETTRRYAAEPWFGPAYAALFTETTPKTTPEEAAANLAAVFPFYFAALTPEVQGYVARLGTLAVNPAPQVQGNGPAQFSADWRAELPAVQVPALVMVGRDDFIQTPRMARELADLLPRAWLVLFEASGHFPWVEERARFHGVVSDFVRLVDV